VLVLTACIFTAGLCGAEMRTLDVTIKADADVYLPNTPVNLTFTIENKTDKEVVLDSALEFTEGLDVRGPDGKPLTMAKVEPKAEAIKNQPGVLAPKAFFGGTVDIAPLFADIKNEGKYTVSWRHPKLEASNMLTVEVLKKYISIEIEGFGTVIIKPYPEYAPKTVEHIVGLIKTNFYDGLTFHRIIKGFMIQGGDPNHDGTGGSGTPVVGEFKTQDLSKVKHVDGAVSMARSTDPDSGDSQFFICLGPQPRLDGQYTVWGQVVQGLDVVQRIGLLQTDARDKPSQSVVMKKVTYVEQQ
jgi:peptidyl-prolyl cis-trans isomerase B (cyclophilin B)